VARAAVRRRLTGPLPWRVAYLVAARAETPTSRTLVLQVDGWPGHRPGQHVDLRLTAEDCYSVQRGYSVASAPDGERIELTVQLLADGEVSPFLVHDYAIGDPVELRGPIGGWFVWDPADSQPVLLIGGGSGIVPLIAILRTRRAVGSSTPFRLLYSVRTPDDVYYRDELTGNDDVETTILYTRSAPGDSTRLAGRLTADDIGGWRDTHPRAYICGPTGFVEAASRLLVTLHYAARHIRTERFGPGGD